MVFYQIRVSKRIIMRSMLIGLLIAAPGCASLWDSVTSREFRVQNLFMPSDPPLVVLEKSVDGDKRSVALASLKEPLANNGTAEDQEKVFKILSDAALVDRQAICRLQAISTLRTFKDSRTSEVLKDAYYRASNFNPETATVIKCQVLNSLGEVKTPSGLELLVKVLKEPAVVGSEQDRQQKVDERIIAAKALGKYKEYQASECLLSVLQSEQDVALVNCCRDSLQAITGKNLPANYEVWAKYLHNSSDKDQNQGFFQKIFQTSATSK